MATASTLTTVRQRAGRELGSAGDMPLMVLVPNTYITALTATTIVAANFFQNSNRPSNYWVGYTAFRSGAASSADYVRPAGTVATATMTHAGENYSDTTVGSETLELWRYGVRPDQELLDGINRAYEDLYFDSFLALSHLTEFDGSMDSSTDTNWNDVGSPGTSAKVTTASRTPYGMRSYHLINASANEGTRSATVSVETLDSVRAFAIASTNVGTSQLSFYDMTGSATFSTEQTVTTSEQEPMLMTQPWTVTPAACVQMRLSLLNTSASGDTFWNMAWLYKRSDLKINLPSYSTEGYKVPVILQGKPRYANPSSNQVYAAQSMELVELVEGRDYDLVMAQPDAQPHAVIFKSADYFDWPLFVKVRRPYSDLGTTAGTAFALEADTSYAPLHQAIPRICIEWLNTVYKGKMPEADWAAKMGRFQEEWRRVTRSRPPSTVGTRNAWGGVPLLV